MIFAEGLCCEKLSKLLQLFRIHVLGQNGSFHYAQLFLSCFRMRLGITSTA